MTNTDIEQLLNHPTMSLIEAYFTLQTHYEQLYGPSTVLLMEVGSFFEVYGIETAEHTVGKPREIAEILNLQLTRKNKSIPEVSVKNPLMAGFPTPTFDRYVSRIIQEKKYTLVIIRQNGVPPQITRHIDTILSPGVHPEYCVGHDDNFITTVVVEKHQEIYSAGYSAIDVSTGKTYLCETHGTKEDPTAALDELFRLFQSHSTGEYVFVLGNQDVHEQFLREYLELPARTPIHMRKQRLSVSYQNELFARAYVITSFLSPIEFLDLEKQPLTSEALAHLIEFVIHHDYKLIQELQKPTIIHTSEYLFLGNNPLEQLTIISRDPKETTVRDVIDRTHTSIGKRLLNDRLLNPILNPQELERRYTAAQTVTPLIHPLVAALKNIYDLERIARRIRLQTLHPFEINFLHESLCAAQEVISLLNTQQDSALFAEALASLPDIERCILYLEKRFDLSQTTKVTRHTIDTNFFTVGYHSDIDVLYTQLCDEEKKLQHIADLFVSLVQKSTGKEDTSYACVKQLDKEGHYILMTKSRYALIAHTIKETFCSIDGTVYSLSDFTYKQQTSTVKITSPIIDTLSSSITLIKSRLVVLVKQIFTEELLAIHHAFSELFSLLTYSIADIDVAVSTAISARDLRLIRPQIIETTSSEDSFLSLHELRHPLIEAKEDNGIYVPNSVVLGNKAYLDDIDNSCITASTHTSDVRGVLLYGINSSGKSSLMKSIGIALVLAQSGMFVPATRMKFTIFSELFTRIVAKDNIEKGLSSFAVEMVELKHIFHRATSKSLVLGDEISHGTETLSSIAIVGATITRLTEKQSLFFFTTHLHQIQSLPLLEQNPHVISLHLQVHYDEKNDTLVFDRALQPGSGTTLYGLEFARSLHMDDVFLSYAHTIRKELAHEYSDLELLTKKKQSSYNQQVYLSRCSLCQGDVHDVHHIRPQKDADEHGNISHFHKDHKYNLLPICKSCHAKIHAHELNVTGFVMTGKGLQLLYDENKNTDE